MKFCEALNTTITEFNLSAKALARASGVREATISEFRRGRREIHTDNLEKLIAALPKEAKQFLFCRILMGEMDSQGMATLLNAVATKLAAPEPSAKRSVNEREPAISLG